MAVEHSLRREDWGGREREEGLIKNSEALLLSRGGEVNEKTLFAFNRASLSLLSLSLVVCFFLASLDNPMHSLAVRRAALVATRAASSSSSSSSRSRSSSSRRGLSRSAALSSSSTTKSPLALLRQRPFPPSPLAPPIYSPRHRQQHVRCYASRKEEDKSWGEIAGEEVEG